MASVPAATTVTPAGLDITTPATAAAATQTITLRPGMVLLIKNGNAGTVVATLTARQTVSDGSAAQLAVPNRTISIATGKYYLVGPFPASVYADANTELTVTFDIFASVLIQALFVNPQIA